MIKTRDLLPSGRSMAALAFSAYGIVVVVGVTAYARLRKTTIGMPPAGFRLCQYGGIRDVLRCVTKFTFDAGVLACTSETRRCMVKGSFVKRREKVVLPLMLSMAADTFLSGHREVISRLRLEGPLDLGMARKAPGTGNYFRCLMALRTVVQTIQMLMSG